MCSTFIPRLFDFHPNRPCQTAIESCNLNGPPSNSRLATPRLVKIFRTGPQFDQSTRQDFFGFSSPIHSWQTSDTRFTRVGNSDRRESLAKIPQSAPLAATRDPLPAENYPSLPPLETIAWRISATFRFIPSATDPPIQPPTDPPTHVAT